ncbi:MAG: hypothetical protein VX622_00180, partial [Pseudomonadota bacterium]|nr:hypothetical protein [Pseudomonadota bacterium]
MNVEQQVDALTASVEDLKGAVVSKKATLDASVADAQSATAQAQAAKANALSARDQAEAFKDAAYSAAQSAASAVAYQDLSAVALTKTVTAVDVFIYDTSKDSDGGAWRHRCAGTSWYREPLNTATRGARREFPAVAVIVAEAAKVTIYDGDDPSLPMWMVFEKGGTSGGIFTDGTSQPHTKITSITALNGKLVVGKGLAPANDAWGGITSWDLISERVVRATTRSVGYVGTAYIPFSERNTVTVGPSTFSEPNPRLINNIVNDVAMTVLPNAPIDRASGLPTPTIYAFTDGGISQVGWDGNENISVVWDNVATASTYGGAKIGGVLPDHRWWAAVQQSGSDPDAWLVVIGETLKEDVSSTFWTNGSAGTVYAYADYSALGVSEVKLARKNFSGNEISALAWPAIGGNRGLALLLENAPEPDAGAVAVVGSTFSSGWMVGDIRAAFLADTNDTDLVQAENLCSDPTCDSTARVDAPSGDWAVIGDMADVNTTSPGKIHIKQGVTGYIENVGGLIPAGSAVAVTFTISNSTTTAGVRCVLRGGGVNAAAKSGTYFGADGKYTVYFSEEEVTGGCYVSFFRFGGHTGTLDIDDISVEIASADRSQRENGLIVNGAIARAPVATG